MTLLLLVNQFNGPIEWDTLRLPKPRHQVDISKSEDDLLQSFPEGNDKIQ